MTYKTLTVSLDRHIATVRLNRPDKANAMNADMWQEIRQAFRWVDATPDARVAILEGEGKIFTAGIDLEMMMGLGPVDPERLRGTHAREPAPADPRPARHLDQPGALPQAGAGRHPRRLHGRRHRPDHLRRHAVLLGGRLLSRSRRSTSA
jgi:enoyl-CoA hydratase/carnithine racemase